MEIIHINDAAGDLPVFYHTEIGWCAVDNGGAQSVGSVYDQGQRPGTMIRSCLRYQDRACDPVIEAVLASDGWYWQLCRPYKYGLPEDGVVDLAVMRRLYA